MPAPNERNDRSETILRAAMHLFNERGYGSVGVDLIGERAGLSGPAIYRYFSGKDEILMRLLDEAIDRVLMSTGGQFEDSRAELEHLVRGHIDRVLDERALMSVWTKERNSIPKSARARLSARIKRYIDRWVECLGACYPGQPREVLVATTHAVHGMIDSTALLPSQKMADGRLRELLTGIALSGMDHLSNNPASGRAHGSADRRARTPKADSTARSGI